MTAATSSVQGRVHLNIRYICIMYVFVYMYAQYAYISYIIIMYVCANCMYMLYTIYVYYTCNICTLCFELRPFYLFVLYATTLYIIHSNLNFMKIIGKHIFCINTKHTYLYNPHHVKHHCII